MAEEILYETPELEFRIDILIYQDRNRYTNKVVASHWEDYKSYATEEAAVFDLGRLEADGIRARLIRIKNGES